MERGLEREKWRACIRGNEKRYMSEERVGERGMEIENEIQKCCLG